MLGNALHNGGHIVESIAHIGYARLRLFCGPASPVEALPGLSAASACAVQAFADVSADDLTLDIVEGLCDSVDGFRSLVELGRTLYVELDSLLDIRHHSLLL